MTQETSDKERARIAAEAARRAEALEKLPARVDALVAVFNGAIKYTPMLQDHPDWTDEQCLAFARKHHATAVARYRAGEANWIRGIPYCRNVWKEPTGA